MPELLTKYPDVALKIFKDAHIKCDKGVQPKILIHCPKQNFCSLPTGELCIYGIEDISKMNQLQPVDIFLSSAAILPFTLVAVLMLLFGILIGVKIK